MVAMGRGAGRCAVGCPGGWGIARWYDASGHTTDADYEQAATDRVTMLLSPDYRQPGRAQRILAGATGEFHDEFAQSADAYTKFVKSRGTVAEGTVDGAAISGRTPDARPFWWRPRSASPAHKTSGPRASGCGCSWPTPTVVPNSRRCNTTMNATSGDTWSRLPPVLRRPIVGVRAGALCLIIVALVAAIPACWCWSRPPAATVHPTGTGCAPSPDESSRRCSPSTHPGRRTLARMSPRW